MTRHSPHWPTKAMTPENDAAWSAIVSGTERDPMLQRLRDRGAWLLRTARRNGGNVSLPSTWDQRAADIIADRGNGVVQFWGGSKPIFTVRK